MQCAHQLLILLAAKVAKNFSNLVLHMSMLKFSAACEHCEGMRLYTK